MKPTFLFTCKIADEDAREKLTKWIDIVEIETSDPQVILDNLENKEGLIVHYTDHMMITKEIITRGKNLKIVGTTYGGTRQNVEDIYALEKGLTVIHTGGSRPRPMAEYTLGLVLSSLLKIHNFNHYMKTTDPWPRRKFGRSRTLQNRKVGVIGYGLIGKGIIELFKHFTDNIFVCSRHLSEFSAKEIGLTKMELNQIFEECEIIILAGGYTPETHHMIGKDQINRMQDEALFVNIARGKMVDQQGLIEVLKTKNIFVALDVFEEEPLEEFSPLRNSDKVLLTPHCANNSIEFEERWQYLATEIEFYYNGMIPKTSLTLERAKTMSSS